MLEYTDSNGDKWEFDQSNGCLHHPCGYLTSWFYERNGYWFVIDWAEVVPSSIIRELNVNLLR